MVEHRLFESVEHRGFGKSHLIELEINGLRKLSEEGEIMSK